MKAINSTKKVKLLSVSVIALLSLTACQSTSTGTDNTAYKANYEAKINSALEKAAVNASRGGKTTESLALLERMYKRDSKNPDTATTYASALRRAKRYNTASMVLSPFARDKELKHINSKIEFASIQSALGNYTTAEEFAKQALEIDDKNAKAHHILGLALDAQGAHVEAEEKFNYALNNWSGDPSMVMNNLGLNLAAQNRFTEAIEILKQASSIAPYRVEIERNLRIVSTLAGDEAITSIPAPAKKPAL
jgi:Flp pilus assembly protein TadD